jgi:hypothetical protein
MFVTRNTTVKTSDLNLHVILRHHKAGENCNVNTANKSYENVAKFKYVGKTVTNKELSSHSQGN